MFASVRSCSPLAFALVALLGATGCKPTTVQAACDQEQTCGSLPSGQTESQCETTYNSCDTSLANGGSACSQTKTDFDAYLTCQSQLLCETSASCSSELQTLENDLQSSSCTAKCNL